LIFFTESRVIIPFRYISEKKISIPTPEEIILSYMNEKIYITLEVGTPKQQIEIPLKFDDNIFYIITKSNSNNNTISEKIFKDKESSTFKLISTANEYNYEYTVYNNCSDKFYFLKNENNEYNNEVELYFKNILAGNYINTGGFGLQKYKDNNDETILDSPLISLKQNNLIDKLIWSIYFNKKEYTDNEEGFLLIGDFPHDINFNLGIYDKFEFNEKSFKTIYDHSSNRFMNYEIKMNDIFFYNKSDKLKNEQIFFNNLNKDDLSKDIIIPQVSISLIAHLDYNFGGISIPEYFKEYLENEVFSTFLKSNDCYKKTLYASGSYEYIYCKKEKSIVNKIKEKIPTIIFYQEYLRYNFTINIEDLMLEKDNVIFFLMFYSTLNKNKWVFGRPFFKKYPFVFNPDLKEIGFYNSFLLSQVKYWTAFKIIFFLAVVFIFIGLLIGKKKRRTKETKKQMALELSTTNLIHNEKDIEKTSKNRLGI
jgi:hypothetical protein